MRFLFISTVYLQAKLVFLLIHLVVVCFGGASSRPPATALRFHSHSTALLRHTTRRSLFEDNIIQNTSRFCFALLLARPPPPFESLILRTIFHLSFFRPFLSCLACLKFVIHLRKDRFSAPFFCVSLPCRAWKCWRWFSCEP